ncbi:FAD/NAD-binding domain-containing protein [Schizopora paradoxa]|uniref:FAD/NAD-binding domain-containing protein n=1 Tax=Schizopora paradoxa TaxID=27342 RepID=A0A0H2SI14_9AGAM|nr:FAD/NAD-binding domain-containing protein [Schizopora paradoxa]
MRVAVIGSGCSGLGASWLLNEHSDHEVHLYEADERFGGHANTVDFKTTSKGRRRTTPVDTGFIVLNPTTYPNFLAFLQHKHIQTVPTEMTFSVTRNRGRFEWAGKNPFTVFCQPKRILDIHLWELIYDVLRFNACAGRLLSDPQFDSSTISIGDYLNLYKYSKSFRDNYLLPMTAAIWSTPPDKCALDFPARTLVQFMHNHHLLQLIGKPSWLTILGGSKVYVNKITSGIPETQKHLSSPVVSVTSSTGQSKSIELRTADGRTEQFDHVIFACHSDAALKILKQGNCTEQEARTLSKFAWNRNEAVLHSDPALMPRSRIAWSCWNYLTTSTAYAQKTENVALTYSMNELQHIFETKFGPVLVTLNPPFEPAEESVQGRWAYDHPVLDSNAIIAQNEMHLIQNKRGISFAGAYLKYGFHEDGFTSGLRAVVEHLGVRPPFAIRDPDRQLPNLWAASVFDFIEGSGLRTVTLFVLSLVLSVLLGFLRIFLTIDL